MATRPRVDITVDSKLKREIEAKKKGQRLTLYKRNPLFGRFRLSVIVLPVMQSLQVYQELHHIYLFSGICRSSYTVPVNAFPL